VIGAVLRGDQGHLEVLENGTSARTECDLGGRSCRGPRPAVERDPPVVGKGFRQDATEPTLS